MARASQRTSHRARAAHSAPVAAPPEVVLEVHVLSFEGPDPYAHVGGAARRVRGLTRSLSSKGHETHLWFVGAPDAPGQETRRDADGAALHLHRWCQWLSAGLPNGVYDGEAEKVDDYQRSLPPSLFERLAPKLMAGERATILAEEHQTVGAVVQLDALLRQAGLRERVTLGWNASDTYGFERIDWAALDAAATVTTVTESMRALLRERGVDALLVPNGLDEEAFEPVPRKALRRLRGRLRERLLLAKVGVFDPRERWEEAMQVVASLKAQGELPLLVARGVGGDGSAARERARALGLRVAFRAFDAGADGAEMGLRGLEAVDVLFAEGPLDREAERTLLRGATAVLTQRDGATSGLLELETMAAGGVACTGHAEAFCEPGENALVLGGGPREVSGALEGLAHRPREATRIRRGARRTARRFRWPKVVEERLRVAPAAHA
ncbi:MAG TPA: glycosyltransferase [Polyangiaceae bacterium LLY-WYZ-15_(1-7)]|nr:glycosyltransferase [Polyangiaceae bacterium LLY-WYZ-15_(1-7)]HJL45357.1 glycosyltransferase [Polyangiaceae bacterium LLY-WYZ-15_(1-7)]